MCVCVKIRPVTEHLISGGAPDAFCTEVTDLCHTLSHSVILAPFALVHTLSLHAPSVCVCSIVMLSVCVSVCGMSDVPHLQPMSCVINLFRAKQGEGQQDRRKVRKESQKESRRLLQTTYSYIQN